ncbi:hypothetical protein CRYUN_Cryun38cG0015200 [Craigia yunnanensis]
MSALRFSSRLNLMVSNRILSQTNFLFSLSSSFSSSLKMTSKNLCCTSNSILHNIGGTSSPSLSNNSPLSGLGDELVGYIFGKKKATEVAHLVWRHVLHKGDVVIDATCGNGYDTVAMLKMVADESGCGLVYGMDIQTEALENTSSLLDETVTRKEVFLLYFLCCLLYHKKVQRNSNFLIGERKIYPDLTLTLRFRIPSLWCTSLTAVLLV